MNLSSIPIKQLHQLAVDVRKYSYSPYSGHQIGASILLSNGQTYTGTNIENASYGGTACAERVAIWKAYSENKDVHITEICVVSDAKHPWPPCGLCRQVMAEFCKPDTKIHVANLDRVHKTYLFQDLLPEAFNADHLKASYRD